MDKIDRKVWTEQKHGEKNWAFIGREFSRKYGIHNKNGKQCRERWNNHVNPDVSRESWTPQEEKILFDLHKIHGHKWSVIAAELKGRTDNSTKNHFYSIVRKNLRRYNKTKPESERITGNVQELLKDAEISKILLKRPRHYYQKKGAKQSDSKKTSTKSSGRSSKRSSRSSIPKLDSDLLKSSLEKVKETNEKPKSTIKVRRSSGTSSIGQFLSPGSLLSCRSSLSKLELNLGDNGMLPSPVFLDSHRASTRSSGCLFDPLLSPAFFRDATPRSMRESFQISEFSRRGSRSNTDESVARAESRKNSIKDEKLADRQLIIPNFPSQLPDYSPRNSFQFNKTPR